ncbi:MAG: MarR family winged helix-turn-helix transcriptional regulator [Phycisphaerales bacterium]|jgi:DNA-binding MarR family transcriptional regulator
MTTALKLPSPIDEIADGCIAFRVRILGRAVSAIYDQTMAHAGMTISQVNIMVFVGKLGEVTPALIGEKMAMEKSTVSRNLKGLIAEGLLSAETTENERIRSVTLTPKGRRRVEAVLPDWREAQELAKQLLGESGTGAMVRLGNKVLHETKTA